MTFSHECLHECLNESRYLLYSGHGSLQLASCGSVSTRVEDWISDPKGEPVSDCPGWMCHRNIADVTLLAASGLWDFGTSMSQQ